MAPISSSRLARTARAAALVLLSVSTTALADGDGSAPLDPATPLRRGALVAYVLAHSPALTAAEHRASSLRAMAGAAGTLPDPELSLDVWQVPGSRPLAVGDAQMIMVGVRQSIPAPGSLGSRERAGEHAAKAEAAGRAERERALAKEAEHAFAAYAEAWSMAAAHDRHRAAADRVVATARARQSGAGSLGEVSRAELEVTRIESEIAASHASAERARDEIDALAGRAPGAPLGPPALDAPETVAAELPELLALARRERAEVRASTERTEAQREALHAAESEARWPSFGVGALWFPPTRDATEHAYGVTASATLPWLWGGAEKRRAAEEALARAMDDDRQDATRRAEIDTARELGEVRVATTRIVFLERRTLPAARRNLDVALAEYESSRGDLAAVVDAARTVTEADVELVQARATLDHALAELDAAVGGRAPRVPVASLPLPR